MASAGARGWLVLAAASAMMVFASATTFSAMGIALFAMARSFGWSQAEAGGGFTVVILACSLSHLAPVPMMARIGGRWTIVTGGAVLAVAFLAAALSRSLPMAYVAVALVGAGFSLVANTPAIYLIAGWFGARAPRVIGIYMMISTLGGAVGPPVAQALISSGGWRLYWTAMLGAALLLIALCALLIREPPRSAMEARPGGLRAGAAPPSGYWRIVRSPRFIVLAAAMVVTQTCIMTVSGVTPAHFSRLGWSAAFAARILGIQGLVGTIATGISGWLTERCDPRLMLGAGLLGQSAAMALLGFPQGAAWMYLFALVFGLGWSVSCLAITVLLVRCFGARGGTAALATIFTFAGAAAAGPWAAGMIADATGSFSTALAGLGLLLAPAAAAAFLMDRGESVGAALALEPVGSNDAA